MQVQARGVAEALGVPWELKEGVRRRGSGGLRHPTGRPTRETASGRQAARTALAGHRDRHRSPEHSLHPGAPAAMPVVATFTVVLQDPKTSANTADLIWVPEHDRRRGANVITTLTAPHGFSPERLAGLTTGRAAGNCLRFPGRASPSSSAARTPSTSSPMPTTIGWKHRSPRCARLGASFMVTPSRRTHQRLIRAVERATARRAAIYLGRQGDNPYPAFLAHADLFVVTGDSVNMTGEPLATGRPVYVFEPSGGSAKFRRFHESLRRYGATRSLPAEVKSLETLDLHAARFRRRNCTRNRSRRLASARHAGGIGRRRPSRWPAAG